MEELDVPPTEKERSAAIDSLAQGKAPGREGIPAESATVCRGHPPAPLP